MKGNALYVNLKRDKHSALLGKLEIGKVEKEIFL
jgi:hypothetical protein